MESLEIADKPDNLKPLIEELIRVNDEVNEVGATNFLADKHEEIQKLTTPEWIKFKPEAKRLSTLGFADLDLLRKSNDITVRSGWELELSLNNNKPEGTLKNCSLFFNYCPSLKKVFRFNDFLQRPCITKNSPFIPDIEIKKNGYKEFDDNNLSQLRTWLANEYEAEFSKDTILDCLMSYSLQNNFNPLVEKLESCASNWDGINRLDNWLIDFCNAEYENDNEKVYLQTVGKMTLISAVARAFEAGCKVDTILILEGKQGDKKSSFLEVLALGYFLELTQKFEDTKKVVDSMFGKWIIELPELKSLKGDQDSVKAFITAKKDNERLSYGRFSKDFPRRSIFIGTTNNDEYLKDNTGNRRYFPVKTNNCDLFKLKKEVEQLWAEAVIQYRKGGKWWLDESDCKDAEILNTVEKIQFRKLYSDEMEWPVKEFLINKNSTTGQEVWVNVFKGTAPFNKSDQMRVSKIIKAIGFEKKTVKNQKRWVRKQNHLLPPQER